MSTNFLFLSPSLNKDAKRYDIFQYSIEYAMERLSNSIFPNKSIPVVFSNGPYHYRELFRRENEISYPFLAVTIDNLGINRQGRNSLTMQRRGKTGDIILGETSSGNYNKIYHFKPVLVNLGLRFISQDYKDTFDFIQNWLISYNSFNFKIGNDRFQVDVHFNILDELQTPEHQFQEIGELNEIETSIELSTYIGYVRKVSTLNKVNTKLNLIHTDEDNDFQALEVMSITETFSTGDN